MTLNMQEVLPPASKKPPEPPRLDDMLGRHVMHTLGRPTDLYAVQVRRLWEKCYRVNVLTGRDATSVKFTHSYFLVVDTSGAIVTSTPAITRQY